MRADPRPLAPPPAAAVARRLDATDSTAARTAEPTADPDAAALFAGSGEMRARGRTLDWAATPLGPVAAWPGALRAAVRLCLDCARPMCVFGGPALVHVYNDAYAAAVGAARHPHAFGRPAREAWADLWDQVGPEYEQVLADGVPVVRDDDLRYFVDRGCGPEETYWTYATSPIRDEDGRVVGCHTLITETTGRVRAQAALRASEERLRLATEAAHMYAWEFDFTTGTPAFSANAERVTGRAPAATFAENLAAVHPDDRATVVRTLEDARREGCGFDYEMRGVRPDGAVTWFRVAGAVLRDEHGEPARAVGITQNVTDRKAIELALRQSEERFRLAAEAVGAIIYDWDVATGRVSRTRGLAEVLGHAERDLTEVADRWSDLIHPDDRARVLAETHAALAGGADRYEIAYRVRHQDGTYRDFWDHGRVVRDAGADGVPGRARRVVGSSLDLTRQTRLEAALRASEGRARALVAALPGAAVFVFDHALRYRTAEGEAFRAAGFAPERFVGRPLAEVLEPALAAEYASRIQQVLAGEPFEWEHEAHGRVFLSRGVPLREGGDGAAGAAGADGPGVVTAALVVSVDVTARHAAEAALAAREAQYRALFTEMDEAYAVVEVLADASGRWADFRFVEVNPAFTRHTGMPHPVGRTATELLGTPNPRWAELYGRVAETGESLRVEEGELTLGRVFDLNIFRLGGPGSRRVAVLFADVTERKREEAVLRARAARQTFLLRLDDALRPLADPAALQAAAARLLGEHLGADRAAYAEVTGAPGAEVGTLRGEWVRAAGSGVPALPAFPPQWAYADFGEASVASRRRGEVLVVADVEADPAFAPAARAAWAAAGLRAALVAPLVKDGRLVAEFGVQAAAPRAWTAEEVALLQEVAERTWATAERARAEAALRDSERRFRALADAAPALIWQNDAEGENRFINQRFLDYTGLSADAIRGAGWHTLVHPDDVRSYVASYLAAVDGRRAWHRRNRIRRHDGAWRWFENYAQPLFDAGERYTGHVGVSVDVTDVVDAERALKASEARVRTLVDNVRDYAIFGLDADGVVTTWAAGAERLKGYPAEEAIGLPLARFYTPEDVAADVPRAHLAEAAAEGRGEWEGWRVRKDGTCFWANEIATAVRDADGRLVGFTKISRDLTERRLAEQAAEQTQLQTARDELRRALAQAEEAERRRLARELHDQLGQHLTAFALALAEARRRLEAGQPLEGRLAHLEDLTRVMTRDARNLALELRPPELDDVGLVSAVETYVAEWAERTGVATDVAVTGLADRAIPADVGSTLYRILQEALTNVARHAHAARASVIVEQPDGHVGLIVEDDGRGFDPEATPVRVRRERRLGLAGMRERAALVGGTVAIESSPGGGTTVFVRLPLGGELPESGPATANGEVGA